MFEAMFVSENDSGPDKSRVVIVGGGPSSLTCCERLRKEGYKGEIVILSKETHPTYDRPKLSKALDVEPQTVYLRPPEYYKEINVDFYHNAVSFAPSKKMKSSNYTRCIMPKSNTSGGAHLHGEVPVQHSCEETWQRCGDTVFYFDVPGNRTPDLPHR